MKIANTSLCSAPRYAPKCNKDVVVNRRRFGLYFGLFPRRLLRITLATIKHTGEHWQESIYTTCIKQSGRTNHHFRWVASALHPSVCVCACARKRLLSSHFPTPHSGSKRVSPVCVIHKTWRQSPESRKPRPGVFMIVYGWRAFCLTPITYNVYRAVCCALFNMNNVAFLIIRINVRQPSTSTESMEAIKYN